MIKFDDKEFVEKVLNFVEIKYDNLEITREDILNLKIKVDNIDYSIKELAITCDGVSFFLYDKNETIILNGHYDFNSYKVTDFEKICANRVPDEAMIKFVEKVLKTAKIKYDKYEIADWDLDNIWLDINDKEYSIRTWNINEDGIRFTLFVDVKDSDKTSHGEELYYGYYNFKTKQIIKY